MIKPVFIVAFSGHRPKAGIHGRSPEQLAGTQSFIESALEHYIQQAERVNGQIQVMTSAASGADLAMLKAAEKLALPYHIILPHPEHVFEQSFSDSPEDWETAQTFIAKSKQRLNGCSFRVTGGSNVPESNTEDSRVDCYKDANYEMLCHADAVITVALDLGNQNKKTISKLFWQDAETLDLPRVNIDPSDPKSDLPISLENLTSEQNNRSGIKLLKELERNIPQLEFTGKESCLQTALQAFTSKANEFADNVRNAVRNIILLHGAASFLAAIAISTALVYGKDYYILFILAALELTLICIAEKAHKRMHHDSKAWLMCRSAGEAIRMLTQIRPHCDPLLTLLENHSLQWRRFILSLNATCGLPEKFYTLVEAKKHYLKNRIKNQRDYFAEKAAKATPLSQKLYKGIRCSSLAAMFIVMIACIAKATHAFHLADFHLPKSLDLSLYLLPVILPLLAGVLLALRQSLDLSRREYRYIQMLEILDQCEQKLAIAHTQHSFESVIKDVEETLLDERLEFEISQKIGLEH